MKCPNCKKKIEKNQKFCNYCGAELKKQEKKKNVKIFLPVGAASICILAIVVAVLVLPKTTPASRLQAKLDLGNKYLEEADYEKAEIAFNEALKIDEKSPDAAMGLADTYNKQKKPEMAAKYLTKASENIKDMKLSEANEYAKRMKEKEDYYRKVIEDITKNHNDETTQNSAETIIYIYTITPAPTQTPVPEQKPKKTPVPKPEEDNSNKSDKITVTPEISETPTPQIPEPTPTPEAGDSTGNPEETPIPEAPVNPEETPIPEPPVNPEETPIPEPPVNPEETPIPEAPVNPEETPIPEPPVNPEETPIPEAPVPSREILISYANETILAQSPYASFNDSAIPYNCADGSGSVSVLNGTLGVECRDLNGDGEEELLVIFMKDGKISFDVYSVESGMATLKGSGTADTGFEGAVEGSGYKGTQELFIKENGDAHFIGIVSHYVGTNIGDGSPCTKTLLNVYSIGTDGSFSSAVSVSCTNGGEAEAFAEGATAVGLSGSWVSEGVDNPELLSGGLSSREGGVEDLVTVIGDMEAGSGSMNMSIENNTMLED